MSDHHDRQFGARTLRSPRDGHMGQRLAHGWNEQLCIRVFVGFDHVNQDESVFTMAMISLQGRHAWCRTGRQHGGLQRRMAQYMCRPSQQGVRVLSRYPPPEC